MPVDRLKSEVNALNILNFELVQKIKRQEAEILLLQDNSLELIETLNCAKKDNLILHESVLRMLDNMKNFLVYMKINHTAFDIKKYEQGFKN